MKREWLRRRGMAPSERAFWRWQSAYCHRISRATEACYYGLGVRADMAGRHPDWDLFPGKEATYVTALYASVLRDAPAAELRTASFALTYDSYGHVPWRYGRDTIVKARHGDRLPSYLRLAVRLVEGSSVLWILRTNERLGGAVECPTIGPRQPAPLPRPRVTCHR
jgi:hypothetical protein